jgi:hypothetical protein
MAVWTRCMYVGLPRRAVSGRFTRDVVVVRRTSRRWWVVRLEESGPDHWSVMIRPRPARALTSRTRTAPSSMAAFASTPQYGGACCLARSMAGFGSLHSVRNSRRPDDETTSRMALRGVESGLFVVMQSGCFLTTIIRSSSTRFSNLTGYLSELGGRNPVRWDKVMGSASFAITQRPTRSLDM